MSESRSVVVAPDRESLAQQAATYIAHTIAAAVAERGGCTLALSGGSTPRRTHELLAAPPLRDGIPWEALQVFWGDERCVPPDHPDSNYRMAREAMLAHLPIPAVHVHRMEAERPDLDAAARDYEAAIAGLFGVSRTAEPPALDLVLLGMGPDGHTASLFPHTKALDETTRWVVPNSVPQLHTTRMTMTRPILNRAREVLFLVAGGDKAERLVEVLTGPSDPKRLPSQSIQPDGPLVWFVDGAAAERLPPSLSRENMQG